MTKQTPDESGNGGLDMVSIMAQEEAEADLFCWDKSYKEEEELIVGVGREAELQVNQTQEEKAGKRKNNA
eukprot:6733084-Ditylum_brightwellii.AAC.1